MPRNGSRGQVLVIFAGAAFLLMALMALVIDVSWYWANTIKVQRAADAAALAGAVMLPGQPDCATGACFVARQEATKNGYTNGVGNVTVTPTQDTSDPRQLDVSVSAPVGTFFMRIIGIDKINATRTSKGLYVLPVPMGSPLAYYGVGDFYVNTPTGFVTSTGSYSSVSGGTWTNPQNASKTDSNYATATNGEKQAWNTLIFNQAGIGSNVSGLIVSFKAMADTAKADGSGSACTVKAEVSWDGTHWGSLSQTTGNLTNSLSYYQVGSSSSMSAWDTSGHAWSKSDFGNSFRVRLTFTSTTCGTLSLNSLRVIVNPPQEFDVSDPASNVLPSLGAWGGILTRGGNQQNGDAYAPENDGGYTGALHNSLYNGTAPNGGGYNYVVKLPAGGNVYVFDPGFCAMGSNPSGAGSLGAGDHWIGTSGTAVSTYYTLWDTGGLLGLTPASWTQLYTSGLLFENQKGYDPQNGSNPGNATSGCDAYHNKWWPVPKTLTAGTYVLQVSTTDPNDATQNQSTNAENMFAIEAIGGGSPTVYGNGKMAVYNNLQPGNTYQLFYLAKIDKSTGAGKTALIDIFDPGDVPGNAVLKVLSPDNSIQTQATFSYTTDGNCVAGNSDSCSGTNVTQITTAVNGSSSFNNTWIHIRVVIPATYGSSGLWGPGGGGWWQIRYETPGGGNDTTTWQVSISGNPVHLIVP